MSQQVRGLKALLAVEKDKASTGDGNRVGLGARYLNTESFSGVVKHRSQGSVSMPDDRRRKSFL
ncbi:MAG: hypothetical protein HUJ31_15555, partial [Pseudomonadales bacterium]|nr:hypothetical protein [Pseudomonadales bacterium]